jgi:hypothetical protein
MPSDRATSFRDPGAILLVSCYELGRQPLSIASPLALLRRAGYRPGTLDLALEPLLPGKVRAARLVALAVPMHTALRLGMRATERIRRLNPGCVVIFYGLYASLNAAYLLAHGADAAIGGEYEEPLLRLAEALEAGGPGTASPRPLPAVPGVRTRDHPEGPWIRRIEFAAPARDGLPPLERYARLEEGGSTRLAGQVEASRGCLHLCRHCPIPPVYEGRFFVVPQAVVLEDVRRQVAMGATHITFGDPDFLNGPGHSLSVVQAMRREFPGLTFDFTAKIEHLLEHRALLPGFGALGCLFVVSAVESLNDRVLRILDKGHTRAGVEEALALMRAAGVALRPSFVPFTPWGGLDDYLDLLDFIARRDLIDAVDPVQLSIRLLVPPGSLLVDHPEMRPHLGPLDAERFTYRWTHSDPRLDRLQQEVARLVERVAHEREDPRVTFGRIRTIAEASAEGAGAWAEATSGRATDVTTALLPPPLPNDKGRPPRLTEPWFC